MQERQDPVTAIQDFEQTFSGARGKRLAAYPRSSDEFSQRVRSYRQSRPSLDEGLGSSITGPSGTGLNKSLKSPLHLGADSALGTSIDEESIEEARAIARANFDNAFEEDSLSVGDLIQGWLALRVLMYSDNIDTLPADTKDLPSALRSRTQRGNHEHSSTTSNSRSAVTQSIAPQTINSVPHQPRLRKSTCKFLEQNILDPLLREDRFKFFHPLVDSLRPSSNKHIKCLRDLEQSLIHEPLVSSPPDLAVKAATYTHPFQAQELSVPRRLYRTFGEFSIQLAVDSYHQLSEPEQRRPADRPYDNGYFLDMVHQVGRLAAQIGGAREAREARASRQETEDTRPEELDEMAYSPDDEVTLEGGLGQTGEIAELVRWKNGKGISLRTNEPYEACPGIKRQHSIESGDDDVARSMARRKKNAPLETKRYHCSNEKCDKIFPRECDLAKHEKTHSRPFKCPEKGCKYHELGLPTEKEKDRHVNDRHSKNPKQYRCEYCPFMTKRESNCKQHMEKKHNWTYERVKGNAKTVRTPAQTPQTPNMSYSSASASPAPSNMGWAQSSASASAAGSTMVTPLEQPLNSFESYNSGPSYNNTWQPNTLFPREQAQITPQFDNSSVSPLDQYAMPLQYGAFTSPAQQTPMTPSWTNTPITPAGSGSNSFRPSPHDSYNIGINYDGHSAYNTGLPTPANPALQPTSRNPSMSYNSPMAMEPMQQFFTHQPAPALSMNTDNFDDFAITDAMPSGGDFPLFGADGNYTTFPSTADVSSAGGQMFPNMEGMGYQYHNDNSGDFNANDFLNDDEMND